LDGEWVPSAIATALLVFTLVTELLTESFCERCGTRFAFGEPPKRPARLGRLKLLSRGLKSYVLSDEASLADALVEAKTEDERRTIRRQLESFQNTFNFCLDCRQYVCTSCWNDPVGRCVECAPPVAATTPAPVVVAVVEAMVAEAVVEPVVEPPFVEPPFVEPPFVEPSVVPVVEPVVEWAAVAEPESQPESEHELVATAAVVEIDPWVGIVWGPEPEEEPDPAPEHVAPKVEAESAFALDATEPATSAEAVMDFGADAAVEDHVEALAQAEFAAPTEPDRTVEPEVVEALPPEVEAVQAPPLPFQRDPASSERGSLLGRIGARRPDHDHIAAAEADITPEDRLRDLFNRAEALSEVVPAPEPTQLAPEPERELEPEPVVLQAAPEPEALHEPISAPAPAAIVEAEPVPFEHVAPPPPAAPAPAAPEPQAPAEVWWIVAPQSDARRDTVPQPVWRGPPPAVVPPPAAFVASHVPTTGPAPAQNIGVWVASSRDVLSRPGTGVQVCVKCALPLSASARFCRRCGSQQA
jgi:hypothetical protein